MNSKLVKTMVEMDELSLFYLVNLSPEDAIGFAAKRTVRYGNLSSLLARINQAIPQTGDGKMWHTFWIGREYSRVVYVEMIETRAPLSINPAKYIQYISDIAREYEVDEISVEHESLTWKIRLCWT